MNDFIYDAGSVTGTKHMGKYPNFIAENNQDAYAIHDTNNYFTGVICDGCGSSKYSDVGARLGSKFVISYITSRLDNDIEIDFEDLANSINDFCISQVHLLRNKSDKFYIGKRNIEDIYDDLFDLFLFTIIGVIITKNNSLMFRFGDGVFYLNENFNEYKYIFNAPPFVLYREINVSNKYHHPLTFQLERFDTKDIDKLLIGSDGVADLKKAEGKKIPGVNKNVMKLDDLIINCPNENRLQNYLTLCNRNSVKYNKEQSKNIIEQGLLPDDTTMIILKRENNV